MDEIKIPLKDGSNALISEVPPNQDGKKRFLVESDDGSFDAFTYTPGGEARDGDGVNALQQTVLVQIVGSLPD